MQVPRPRIESASMSALISVSTSEPHNIVQYDLCDSGCDFESKSDDPNYHRQFKALNRDWKTWEMYNSNAQDQIIKFIDTASQSEYQSIKELKALSDKIKSNLQEIIKLNGKSEPEKLAT
ncbi:hypothetical protein K440DRAFT_646560 [Wilcoxina mikolae CBS 423.85]|nr:hypothetical protein K440DRAFT_646560 [Wilcoxina mikolae CBS 423.85]